MSANAPVTHFLDLTTLRRERLLPVSGKVLARRGQRVNASDVVAEALLHPEHILLDVARGLGVPADKADQYIQHKAGDEVAEGDLLAGPVGMARRALRAPRSGRVVVAGDAQILLQVDTAPFELHAGYPGTVVDLVEDRGVVIETVGMLVQGVWGNGRTHYGLLRLLGQDPAMEILPAHLDVSQRGAVLMAGTCQDASVLSAGDELPLRGLILGSMDSSLEAAARRAHYPIILLDGFGSLPMNPQAHQLLAASSGREVAINAEVWDRYRNTRPEVVIGMTDRGNPSMASDVAVHSVGQKVRLISPPYMARLGTITRLPGVVVVPSGVRTQAAEVRLDEKTTVLVPIANLEILE